MHSILLIWLRRCPLDHYKEGKQRVRQLPRVLEENLSYRVAQVGKQQIFHCEGLRR